MTDSISDLDALFYDDEVPDWPGEIDFYQKLAEALPPQGSILEVACGTGRVALRLARGGRRVVGADLSEEMLDVARSKSQDMANLGWAQADMRAFELGERFDLAISPGHSFQYMLTPGDQLATLESIRRHLKPGGRLVLHLDYPDLPWLAELSAQKSPEYKPARPRSDPRDGRVYRASYAWWLVGPTQTASFLHAWEELDAQGTVIARREMAPRPLHVVHRFEIEHLLPRAGFSIEAVYGDFFGGPLGEGGRDQMVWVAAAR